MSTASCAAARASSRRPRSLSLLPRLLSEHGEIGAEGVGPCGGEAAVDVDRLLRGGEGVLAPAEVAQPIAEIVERHGEIGRKASGRSAARRR